MEHKSESSAGSASWHQPVLLAFFIGLAYQSIWMTFGYQDDYNMVWHNYRHHSMIPLFIAGGRLITGYVQHLLFHLADGVENLRYIRAFSLAGVWVSSVLFWRYLVWLRWDRTSAMVIALLLALTPSAGIYVLWSILSLVPWAFGLSLVAGILAARLAAGLSRTGQILVPIIAVLLMETALFIYQPAAMAYLLVVVAFVLARPDTSFKQLALFGIIFVLALLIYYPLFRYTLHAYNLPTLGRAQLDVGIFSSLGRFFTTDLKAAVGFSFPMISDTAGKVAVIIGYVILVGFFVERAVAALKGRTTVLVIVFLAAALPVTYLPRLASAEKWICFRTLGVTAAYVVVIAGYLVGRIRPAPVKRIVSILLVVVMTAGFCYAINERFVRLQTTEYKLASTMFRRAIAEKPGRIDIVTPAWYSYTTLGFADEYAIASTMKPWALIPFFNWVVAEETGIVDMKLCSDPAWQSNLFRVIVHGPDDPLPEDSPCLINLKELIESF